ncbi:hypothetical protein ACSU1N_04970 [Thermogladius sp. 4427co]|uniref:hypothetical protein n=1 Tax=Thermogladius sp. 4427co TaxID=3450718 RepID=UPI003F7AFAF6
MLIQILRHVVALVLVLPLININIIIPSARMAGLSLLEPILQAAVLILSVATIVTVMPQLYAIALILSILINPHDFKLMVLGVAGFLALSFLDTFFSLYNLNQWGWTYYGAKKFLKSIIQLLLTLSAFLIVSLGAAGLATAYFNSMTNIYTSFLSGIISSSLLYKILLLTFLTIYMLFVVREFFTIFILYAKPNPHLAIQVLGDTGDIDIVFSPVLGSLKTMVVASLFSPLIYQPVYNIVSPVLSRYVSFLGEYSSIVLSLALALFVWILSVIAIYRLDRLFLDSPLQLLYPSLILLSLMYSGGVYYAYIQYRDLVKSLIAPDFTTWSINAVDAYKNYYLTFYSIIEILPRLMGVAP